MPLSSRMAVVVLGLAVCQCPAQQPVSAGGGVPTIRTTARLVVLDVVVIDGHGHPVRDLKPSDFTLYEDNKPQRLLSSTEHDAQAEAPPADPMAAFAAALPTNTFAPRQSPAAEAPKTVIVLDNLAFPDAPVFRSDMRAFFDKLPPNSPVAIFRIDWQGLHLVQDFTSSAATLADAVNGQRILPPGPFRTRVYQSTLPPVTELAHLLAPIPGRINLVWVGSSRIPNPDPAADVLFGEDVMGSSPSEIDRILGTSTTSRSRDLQALMQELGRNTSVLRLSRVALYPIDARGLIGNSTPADLLAGEAGGQTFSGLGANVLVSTCQGMREAGLDTGGKGFCGTNDLKSAMIEAVTAGSHFYTLAYVPQNAHWNGAFRHIRVEIKDALHETSKERAAEWVNLTPRVVYRNGYYARDVQRPGPVAGSSAAAAPAEPDGSGRKLISYSPKGDPQLPGNTLLSRMQLAMTFSLGDRKDLPLHVTVEASPQTQTLAAGAPLPPGDFMQEPWRAEPFRMVTLHVSLDPEEFSFSPAGLKLRDQFQLVAVVFRDNGLEVNSAALTIPLEITQDEYDRILNSGIALNQTIAMPAGAGYYLRVGVEEVNSGRISTVQIPSEWIKIGVSSSPGGGPRP